MSKMNDSKRSKSVYLKLIVLCISLAGFAIIPILIDSHPDGLGIPMFWMFSPLAVFSLFIAAIYGYIFRTYLGWPRALMSILPALVAAIALLYWLFMAIHWQIALNADRFYIYTELKHSDNSPITRVEYFRWGKYKHLTETEDYSTVHFSQDGTGSYKLTRTKGKDTIEVYFWDRKNSEIPPLFNVTVHKASGIWSEWTLPINAEKLSKPIPQIRYKIHRKEN